MENIIQIDEPLIRLKKDATQFLEKSDPLLTSKDLSSEILAGLFNETYSLEKEIHLRIQSVLETINIGDINNTTILSNLDNALEILSYYRDILDKLDIFAQKITPIYFKYDQKNKDIFMSQLLGCDMSSADIKVFDNFLNKIRYRTSLKKENETTNHTDMLSITFCTDLMKLISTKAGIDQIKKLYEKMDENKNYSLKGSMVVIFRNIKTMAFSHNAQKPKFNVSEDEIKSFNNQFEDDIPGYINAIIKKYPYIQPHSSELSDTEQIMKYPLPNERSNYSFKFGSLNGKPCILLVDKISSFYHELAHALRAQLGDYAKDIPAPVMMKSIYGDLEEFYTIVDEQLMLNELNFPPRKSHGGIKAIQLNNKNDKAYLKQLSNEIIYNLALVAVELGLAKDLFNNVRESLNEDVIKLGLNQELFYNLIFNDLLDKIKYL